MIFLLKYQCGFLVVSLFNTIFIMNRKISKYKKYYGQRVLIDLYRGPGYFAVVRFGSSPTPSPSSVSNIDRRYTRKLRMRDNLLSGRGGQGRGGRGAEAYRKKGWSSVKHSILSDYGSLPNCAVLCSCKIRYTAAPIVKHPAMSLFCRPFKSFAGSGNLSQAQAIYLRLWQSLSGSGNLFQALAVSLRLWQSPSALTIDFRLWQSLSGSRKIVQALVIYVRLL